MTRTVTVSVHRRVSPEHVPEATRWVQAGVNLANRYPGFLGSGWVRDGEDSHDWHLLYRFADAARLAAWETSDERAAWLARGRGLVEEQRVVRRTGIEGWFDAPAREDDAPPAVVVPPRWKQSVSIWLAFFPLNLLVTVLLGHVDGFEDVPVVLRVLGTTLLLTPIMTYLLIPWVTRLLRPWLTAPRRT
ncbi:antibiotic biosynthesis monooxygenase [Sediminihabitans luteus]|nr:antibiotic biosynthesis monooxygenase [Sediminihabitans luteus]